MVAASMKKALDDRALHIVRKGLMDCTGKNQCIHFLTALIEQARKHLDAQLDSGKS